MITYPNGCAEPLTNYPELNNPYTVISITVSYGAKICNVVLMDCPVDDEILRRYQIELHRIGVTISVLDLLNWALQANSSLDVYPVAKILTRLKFVDMSDFIPVVAGVLSDLGSDMQIRLGKDRLLCRILEYHPGTMVTEVTHAIKLKPADCFGIGVQPRV